MKIEISFSRSERKIEIIWNTAETCADVWERELDIT